MARTVQEIQQQIIDAKNASDDLSALNSVSNTAIWRLWTFIQAQIIHYFEVLMDAFKVDIQFIIDNNQYGTLTWWFNTMKAYQHGDLLIFINNVFRYAAIDPEKQIIKYCSVTDVNGRLQVKVAKQEGNEPEVLTTDELNGVVDYIQQIRPAGTQVTVQSLAADLIRLQLNVYYNANGDINIIQPAVELAITNYLTQIQFDGVFYINRLIDAIQGVPGIVEQQVEVLEAAAKSTGDPYVVFTSKFAAKSGYFKIDPAYPLAAQITYLT